MRIPGKPEHSFVALTMEKPVAVGVVRAFDERGGILAIYCEHGQAIAGAILMGVRRYFASRKAVVAGGAAQRGF